MTAEVLQMATVRELREQRGWSQFELAVKTGVTPATIYNWETRRRKPTIDHLRKLAEVFGVRMEDIDFEEAGGER
jgi:transcriptional regulator with XRE-family HTH domain